MSTTRLCPRCGKPNADTRIGNWILLNPVLWLAILSTNKVEAPDYCGECAAPLTLAGLVLVLIVLAVLFFLFVIA